MHESINVSILSLNYDKYNKNKFPFISNTGKKSKSKTIYLVFYWYLSENDSPLKKRYDISKER